MGRTSGKRRRRMQAATKLASQQTCTVGKRYISIERATDAQNPQNPEQKPIPGTIKLCALCDGYHIL